MRMRDFRIVQFFVFVLIIIKYRLRLGTIGHDETPLKTIEIKVGDDVGQKGKVFLAISLSTDQNFF
jgi:hypothetical protein